MVKETIRSELESSRSSFHALVASLSEEDLRRKSLNPGWTNGEILFHMLLGFMIVPPLVPLIRIFGRLPDRYSLWFARMLDSGTGIFNWFNALGARGGAKVFTTVGLRARYDRVLEKILRLLQNVRDDEWKIGMHYPTKWDASFSEYITFEKLFLFPTIHYRFHLGQVSRERIDVEEPG